MKTVLLADRRYKSHPKSEFLQKAISSLTRNTNDYYFHIDSRDFISLFDLKVKTFREVLNRYSEDEIVMLIDSFDTYVVAADSEIEEKFLLTGADVLYSTEKNCYPNTRLNHFFENEKFLNSGGIIFRNGKFQKILDLIIATVEYSASGSNPLCDQYLHSTIATAALLNVNVMLDTENSIFQSLFLEDVDNFNMINDRYLNIKTGSFPCVFHGNGVDGFNKLTQLFN